LRQLTMVGLGALVVGTVVSSAFAIACAFLLALPVGDVVIAFAPGALEAMTTLAFVLNLDPAYVGTHHIARLIFVSLMIPIVMHALQRWGAAPKSPGEQKPSPASGGGLGGGQAAGATPPPAPGS
jgi:uncharacterized membrane protein AbrB (regulator of aidB expression)